MKLRLVGGAGRIDDAHPVEPQAVPQILAQEQRGPRPLAAFQITAARNWRPCRKASSPAAETVPGSVAATRNSCR